MTVNQKIKYLKIALMTAGIACLCIWPLTIIWPSGWVWHAEGRSHYLEMIIAVYATLGVFLILASRDPLAHRSLISFTVYSSVVHGFVMTFQALEGHHNMGHLFGDIPALFIVAIVLTWLMPSKKQAFDYTSGKRHF